MGSPQYGGPTVQRNRLLTPTDWMPGPGERTSVKGSYGLKRCFHNSDSGFFPLLVFPFPRMQKALSAFLHLCSVLSSAFRGILLISNSGGWGARWAELSFLFCFLFWVVMLYFSLDILFGDHQACVWCMTQMSYGVVNVTQLTQEDEEKDPSRWFGITFHTTHSPFLTAQSKQQSLCQWKRCKFFSCLKWEFPIWLFYSPYSLLRKFAFSWFSFFLLKHTDGPKA